MTATVTPITARRHRTDRQSLTHEPYLLNPPGRLHRVDTAQMPADTGAALGACKLPRRQEAPQHPADESQGHGLDHLVADQTLSALALRWARRILRRG